MMSQHFDLKGTWFTRTGVRFKGPVIVTGQGTGIGREQKLCMICKGTGKTLAGQISSTCPHCRGVKFVNEKVYVYAPHELERLNLIARQTMQQRYAQPEQTLDQKADAEERKQRVDLWLRTNHHNLWTALQALPTQAGNAFTLLHHCYERGQITDRELARLHAIIDAVVISQQRIGQSRFIGNVGQWCYWDETSIYTSWANKFRDWFVYRLWDARLKGTLVYKGPLQLGRQGDTLIGLRAQIRSHLNFKGERQTVIDGLAWDNVIRGGAYADADQDMDAPLERRAVAYHPA